MVRLKDYIETAYNAVLPIVGKVYLDRPQSVGGKIDRYAVVGCPNYISEREIGTGEFDYSITTINIDIFVKDVVTSDKTNQLRINVMDDLVQKTMALFPIVNTDKSVKIHNPRVIFSSSDGDGWHYALITARLTTYF